MKFKVELHQNSPEEWEAFIYIDGIDHHAIGFSPQEALRRLSFYWDDLRVKEQADTNGK